MSDSTKFPLSTNEWELRESHDQHPPEEWRGTTGPPMEQLYPCGLILVLAWLDGGRPRTLWGKRRVW